MKQHAPIFSIKAVEAKAPYPASQYSLQLVQQMKVEQHQQRGLPALWEDFALFFPQQNNDSEMTDKIDDM